MDGFDGENRVVINISGVLYETRLKTLARYPHTLLGDLEKRRQYYNSRSQQYYFNRNRQSFEAILYYYQSHGRIEKPPDIPFDVFRNEVEFFQLGDEVLNKLFRQEGYVFDTPRKLPDKMCQKQVWQCLEYPDSSRLANTTTVLSLMMIGTSILLTMIMTVSECQAPSSDMQALNETIDGSDLCKENHWMMCAAELVINCFFALEFVLRLSFSPDKWLFIKSPLNIVDLLAFLPYMVTLAFPGRLIFKVSAFHILRIVRIFRIFKISRYSRRLKVIGHCLMESVQDLGLFIMCLVIITILASSLLYYIEGDLKGSSFNSIPSTFWFVIQTISTIGYGDEIPLTPLGKLAASALAVFDVITLALPVLSFVARFHTLYSQNIDLLHKS